MKQHKFKRIANDLIELVTSNRYEVDYKFDSIWITHFSSEYERGVTNINLDNNYHTDNQLLERFEHAKKVLKGETLIDDKFKRA